MMATTSFCIASLKWTFGFLIRPCYKPLMKWNLYFFNPLLLLCCYSDHQRNLGF
uniref:Uncharacterized protein n=1 Tax=Arundo donax TaxID=35708 RepID=A0A0A9EKK8_ARUDO